MNIKLVGDETPEVGIIPIVKALNQLHKINESKTVNRLDLESIDSNIPNAFVDKDTGWTFKHLPSGISSLDNSNSRKVINDAICNLSEMLDTRYKSLVMSYGVLLHNLDNISSILSSKCTDTSNGVLLNMVSSLFATTHTSYGHSPLVSSDDEKVFDFANSDVDFTVGYILAELEDYNLNQHILKLNMMNSNSTANSIPLGVDSDNALNFSSEYNCNILKYLLDKDKVTFTDISGLLSNPEDALLKIRKINGEVMSLLVNIKKQLGYKYISDTDTINWIRCSDISNKYINLTKDLTSIIALNFVRNIRASN